MTEKEPTQTSRPEFDIFVIGGGINGAGIAREASAAGYSVCLCDAADFGGGTSSASTKLVHGGLRYLEHYEFRLVREALIEREILWKMAPHIIWPLRFVLPHHRGLRPRWLIRLGLFMYDHMGGRKLLPATRSLDLKANETGKPLKKEFRKAFEYSDCWVEDSRLVILNLQDAQDMGASINPRTKVVKVKHDGQNWEMEIKRNGSDKTEKVSASLVINTAGPWVDEVLRQVFGLNHASNVRLVKGSHIVIRKKFEHDRAYIFQNQDGRIIFAIPYEQDFTLIGTTDVEQESVHEEAKISQEEIEYLCRCASEYFEEPVETGDIIWTYSGVRPLYDDGASKAQEATRDYVIKAEENVGSNDLINVFGGKITTFRKLARNLLEEVEDRLGKKVPRNDVPDFYKGGDFAVTDFDQLVNQLGASYSFADREMLQRLARLYGTQAWKILENCKDETDLGEHFCLDLYAAELHFLKENEWAETAEDALFRRTKLGIRMTPAQIAAVDDWMQKNRTAVS